MQCTAKPYLPFGKSFELENNRVMIIANLASSALTYWTTRRLSGTDFDSSADTVT